MTSRRSEHPARPGFGVVILAAGASSRMGKPKLLLPWGATSILGHLVRQWSGLGAAQVAVVRAAKDTFVAPELDRLKFPAGNRIDNPAPERGMFGSVQCAARWEGWKPDLTHWVIVLGDQPQLRLKTLGALLDVAATRPHQICQPARQGRPRHPVVLPARAFAQLADCRDQNLREFLENRSSGIAFCELDDPGLDFDLDTPADYERACALFSGDPG